MSGKTAIPADLTDEVSMRRFLSELLDEVASLAKQNAELKEELEKLKP